MELNQSKKTEIYKVKNRFLPLTEAVHKGLESESKFSDFNVIKTLGEGSFGKVHLVTHKKTGGTYAIKAIDKRNKNNQEGKPYFRREIEIMYKVHHPNIVRLFSHFEDDEYCYFVMEYISKGNLYTILSKQKTKCFEAKTVASFIRDLISSVYYLHNMEVPIVHRDIKPENVLLHEDGRIKLTDFGWSNYIDENEVRSTYCGTPVYLAPEMIKEIGHDEHLDIWSIGVLLFELLTGVIPFPGNNLNSLSENILKSRINWPRDMNLDAKNLISKILKPDPKDRISLLDMLKHPFFVKNISNPIEFLYSPKDIELGEELKPFFLTKDLPTAYNLKEKILKTKEDVKENPIELSKSAIQMPQQIITHSKKDDIYKDLNSNIKELYDKLKLDYEALAHSYNELVLSKSEMSKKNEDLADKEIYFKIQKELLLKELEEKDNEKLNLQKNIAELNEKLVEKENKIKNLKKSISIFEDKRKKDEQEIQKLNEEINKNSISREDLIKEYNQKISDMQIKLTKDDDSTQKTNTNSRENISFAEIITSPNNNNSNEDGECRKRIENELRDTKEYFANEIEMLRKEMSKEREKYNLILKNKEIEISKLIDEKAILKDNEAKKYEKIFNRYELTLKLRETEIENFKIKLKKYENMIVVKNYKK